jgi:O-methyltransferase
VRGEVIKVKQFTKKIIGKVIGENHVLCSGMSYVGRKRADFVSNVSSDYVRISMLELIANEISELGISGNVAELGVYRGDFAKYINKAFPNRKLYLFDTFQGFDNRDIQVDVKMGFSGGAQDFSQTSVDFVLNKMTYPQNCIVKQGFFPESASDADDTFAFVSIDTDLYEPIYSGLCYFYPKITGGGSIFVHDYNNLEYQGARKAVRKFCQENAITYFPLCDVCGSAIIRKP